MARTLDPAASNSMFSSASNQPFATNWTQDSWYNVYSWVNSQSHDSEGGESSIRSSTSSSQPQISPKAFDDRDHPLLCDSPSSPFDRNETTLSPLFSQSQNATTESLWSKPTPCEKRNNSTESDYNLIHELLKLNLNNPTTSAPVRRSSSNQLFSSTTPSTSSPWSLPPDEPIYRPSSRVAPRQSPPNTWKTCATGLGGSNDYEFDIFAQLHQIPNQPSGVDMTYIMQQQQQQAAAALAAQQQLPEQQQQQQCPTSVSMKRIGIVAKMQPKIDDTSEEYRQLEKERKQTEAELARHHLGKKISSSNGLPIPRLPTAPSKVDRLIVDFFREHARITTLLVKMEHLTGQPIPAAVHKTLADLLDAITLLQNHRSIERNVIIQRLRGESPIYDDEKEGIEACQILSMVKRAATRVRAANWCSLINTLGPLDETQRSQVDRIVQSDYTIAPPPIRPRPLKL